MQTNGNAAARMTLAAVTKGKIARPLRIVLYGTEGIGKTSFAADAPSPIFLPSESGTDHLDVSRLPAARSYAEAHEALDLLLREKHDFSTLAVDTVDGLEPLVWAETCCTKKVGDRRAENIEDFGYGKGYQLALDVWRPLLVKLDALRNRGMTIILIAHSQLATFKSPDTEDFQRFELKLNSKASGLIKEWADCVLFTRYETLAAKVSDRRYRGVSTGARLVFTQRTAAYDAKQRQGLPESFPLSWEAFAQLVASPDPNAVRMRIAKMLDGRADLRERVVKAMDAAGDDASRLVKIENHLAAMVAAAAKEEQVR